MKRYAIALLTLILVGCAVPRPQEIPTMHISAPFDAAAAQLLFGDGPNTIKGNALMRQRGGAVVTCAGNVVGLIPATAYASERIRALYGSTQRGLENGLRYQFDPDFHDYHFYIRKATCDSQGNFVFEKVADGDFYVIATVAWQVGYKKQGGGIMQRISVHGGETLSVVLAP